MPTNSQNVCVMICTQDPAYNNHSLQSSLFAQEKYKYSVEAVHRGIRINDVTMH